MKKPQAALTLALGLAVACGDASSSSSGSSTGAAEGSTSAATTPTSPSTNSTTGSSAETANDVSTGDTSGASTDDPEVLEIVAGERIGDVVLGDRWLDLSPTLGEADSILRFGNLLVATFPPVAVELLFAAEPVEGLGDASLVLSIAARAHDDVQFGGDAVPGASRSSIVDALGPPQEDISGTAFYTAGLSVTYDEDDIATAVAVFAPYEIRTTPPPMAAFGDAR